MEIRKSGTILGLWACWGLALLLAVGCSTVRTAWHAVAGTPVARVEKAEAKAERAADRVDAAKDTLVDDAHTKVVLAELLSRYIAEQSKTADALKSTLTSARADLDTARGSLPPDELSGLRQLVEQLRSDNTALQRAGEQALSALEKQSGQHAEILRAAIAAETKARERVTELEQKERAWALERDATARKWDRLWFWIWVAAGAWFAAQLLPLAAKLIPQLAPAATVVTSIASPLASYALTKAKALANDASAALHNVVTTVQAKAPELAAKIEEVKSEWITAHDGTTTAYTAALKETNQI